MRFVTVAFLLSAFQLFACGTGSGRVTTTVTAQRAQAPAGPDGFAAAAKPEKPSPAADSEESAAAISGAVSAVTLAVEKVVAHRTGEGNPNVDEGTEVDGEEGWEVLVDAPKSVTLLGAAATDTTQAVLGTSELAEGKYTQIRLYLSPTGSTITVSGAEHPLTVPSGALKLVGNAAVEADKSYKLNLHFDLDHGLVNNAQGYKLKPTVKYGLVPLGN